MGSVYFEKNRRRHVAEWRDPRSRKIKTRYFREKAVANRFLSAIERALDRYKAGETADYEELVQPKDGRNSREALITGYVASGKPDRSEKQTKTLTYRLTKALAAMKVEAAGDVTLERATAFVRRMTGSPKTVADYATMLRSFSKWLWRTERLPTDRLGGLLHGPTRVTQRPRRWISFDEQVRLMAAAPVRPVVQRRKACPGGSQKTRDAKLRAGLRHQLIYAILPATGMRVGELNRLVWGQVDLKAREIHFRPHRDGERTKGQRGHRAPRPELQVLPRWLARELTVWRDQAAVERGGPVDPAGQVIFVENHFVRDALRPDARYAEVDLETDDGLLDAHALGRTSCVSFLLDQGVDEILRNLYTRHRPPTGTQARHYARVDRERLHEIAALFPDPFEELRSVQSELRSGWLLRDETA